MKKVLLSLIIIFISSCADTTQLLRNGVSTIHLKKSKSIYISVSRDGRYGNQNYHGSGINVSQLILMSFSKFGKNNIEIGSEHQSFKESLSFAKDHDYGYLIVPSILEWEDRATEWSGIPDKVSIKISIIDVSSGEIIDSVIIKGKSGVATFGGDHPQDLLPKPIEQYTASLY